MTVLVTGAAGFIGFHVAQALLGRGETVVGLDNLSPYYDVRLKRDRLSVLEGHRGFSFIAADVADREAVFALVRGTRGLTHIVHMAAQAGVRHSLSDPYAYVDANVMGQVVMLEAARLVPALTHFVYASSSSVYGANAKVPFSIGDPVDQPVSLYAATKRADELIAQTYAHLYGLPLTGLRFFTVYGPWGRPDMAAYKFARAIAAGQPIDVYNQGDMARDFTYIDDIVAGVVAALDRPAQGVPPHQLYNLGNHRPERLLDFIGALERALGRAAILDMKPMQPGDVPVTYADITESARDLGYRPQTSIAEGIPRFVSWFLDYHKNSL